MYSKQIYIRAYFICIAEQGLNESRQYGHNIIFLWVRP